MFRSCPHARNRAPIIKSDHSQRNDQQRKIQFAFHGVGPRRGYTFSLAKPQVISTSNIHVKQTRLALIICKGWSSPCCPNPWHNKLKKGKLYPNCEGPFVIEKVNSNGTYLLIYREWLNRSSYKCKFPKKVLSLKQTYVCEGFRANNRLYFSNLSKKSNYRLPTTNTPGHHEDKLRTTI